MAFTGIKDIDYIILEKLDNVSCAKFLEVYTQYDTDEFWKKRVMREFEKKHGYKMDIGLKCQYTFQRGRDLGKKCSSQGWGKKNNEKFYCRQCLKRLAVKKIASSWTECFFINENINWKEFSLNNL